MPTTAAAPQTEPEPIGHQEGSRWINRRPTGEEFAAWFRDNVKLHPDMDPEKYVTGCVLIGGKEKLKEARRAQNGDLTFADVERYAWTPYAKIETRIAYFWDLLDITEGVVGAIEPVPVQKLTDAGVYNINLPDGFFRFPIVMPDGKVTHFTACGMQVKLYNEGTLEWHDEVRKTFNAEGVQVDEKIVSVLRGIPRRIFPPATKMIANIGSYGEDPFVIMKAETGAVGRALGMAGMLVIPGSGVATAEDMQEAQAGARGVAQEEATVPEVTATAQPEEVDVRDRINELIVRLQTENPDGYEQLAAWAKEKKIDIDNPKETQLRGLMLQVERKLG